MKPTKRRWYGRSGKPVAISFARCLGGLSATAPQNAQPPPTFRAVVALVPLDVRVIDNKTGRPVSDLKQEDFTILEDRVRQKVAIGGGRRNRPSTPRSRPGD